MWLINCVFCAFLLSHVILTSVTCEKYYEFKGNKNEDTPKFSTDPTPDDILTLKKLVQSATEDLVHILMAPKTTNVKKEKYPRGFFESDNDYRFNDYKKISIPTEKENKKAIFPQHKNPFTPRKFIQYDGNHKIENDKSGNDYSFDECEENENIPLQKEGKNAFSQKESKKTISLKKSKQPNSQKDSQDKYRITPRKYTIQRDGDNFSINHTLENKTETPKFRSLSEEYDTQVYEISEDDVLKGGNNFALKENLNLLLTAEPRYYVEIKNLIKGLLKGEDISHYEDFNILPSLQYETRAMLTRFQSALLHVKPQIREKMCIDLETIQTRTMDSFYQMLEKKVPIGQAIKLYPDQLKKPKKTIIIVVPANKAKKIKVDELTDIEYHSEMGSLMLYPTFRAKIRSGSDLEGVIVTYYPSGKQFIIKDTKLFTCEGYLSEETVECDGRLKPFLPAKLEDNCYLNNFPKALGHVCLSKSGKDVYMFYKDSRLVCQTDAEDVQHMTFEAVNRLCSNIASSATYTFHYQPVMNYFDFNAKFGIYCNEKYENVCQLDQSLVLTENSNIPLNV